MAYLNKIDINGRTYYLQHLTDGKYEAKLPMLKSDTELLLRNQVVNSVTSNDSQNGSSVPLSAAQGYLLNTKLNQMAGAWEADVDEERIRAEAAEKVLTDNLAQEVTDRANAVTTEQNRATAKENEISTNLTTEINRAKGVESDLQSKITTEATTARAAEKANADAIAVLNGSANGSVTKAVKDAKATLESEIAKKLDAADAYVHPSYTAYTSGLYKITIDEFGHVSSVVAVSKDDIVGLGIPEQDTTYDNATHTIDGLLSSSDKTTYDGYAGLIAGLQSQIDELKALVESYRPVTEPEETE